MPRTPLAPALAAMLAATLVAGVAVAAAPAAAPGTATAATAVPVEVRGAWARPTPPGASVGAAYFEIRSRAADRLLAVTTPAARRTELHETSMVDGVARMRRVDVLAVEAGRPLALQPGGLHLMLFDLAEPLAVGGRFPLELRFEKAGVVRAEVVVRTADEAAKDAAKGAAPGANKGAGHAHH